MQPHLVSIFVMMVHTYSAQVCAVQQPPTTWGAWRPHRGPACPWQQEGPPPRVVLPPRNLSPTPTPVAKVVRPPPMVKVVQPPMKKARAEEHPWSKKEARAEDFSQEEMKKWDSWADEAVRRANKNAVKENLAEEAVAPKRNKIRVKRIVRVKKVRPVGADAEENVDGGEADGSGGSDKEKEAPDDEHAHVEGGLLNEMKSEPTTDDEHAHVEEGLHDDELAHVEGLHDNEHVHVEGLHDVEHVHVEGLHDDEHAHVEGLHDTEYSPATTTMDDEQEHFDEGRRGEDKRVHVEMDDEREHVEGGLHDEREPLLWTTEEERKWYGGCTTKEEEDDADALRDLVELVVAWNQFEGIQAGAEEHGEEGATSCTRLLVDDAEEHVQEEATASCTHEVVDDAEEHGEEEAATSCTRLVVDDAEEHVQEEAATSCTREAVDEESGDYSVRAADADTESSNDTSTHTYGPDRSSEYEPFEDGECEEKFKETGLPPPSTFLSLFHRIPPHRG